MQMKQKNLFTRVLGAVLLIAAVACGAASAFAAAYQDYAESWNVPFTTGDSLYVSMDAADIVLDVYEGAEVSAAFEGRLSPSSDGSLPYIEAKKVQNLIELKVVMPRQGMLSLSPGRLEGTLTILVPEGLFADINLNTFSGAISMENASAQNIALGASSGAVTAKNMALDGGDFSANTFSGEQDVQNITARNVDLTASSGHIAATSLSAQDGLAVTTFSGNQRLEALAAGSVQLEASSGTIRVDEMTASGDVLASTFSGEMDMRRITAAAVDLSASSGAVKLNTANVSSLSAETFSGDLSLADVTAQAVVTLETSSGDVTASGLAASEASLQTFSGSASFTSLAADAFQADISSGRCSATFVHATDVYATSFSGDFDLSFPKDTGIAYAFDTFSGNITVEAAQVGGMERNDEGRSGVIGDGATQVSVETSGGDLVLRVGA